MKLRIVPARTGIAWVKDGIRVFWRQPMALSALYFMTIATMLFVSILPFIGPVLAQILLPSATLAMMVASAETMQGRFPTPALLLVAFRSGRQRLRAMAVLGMLCAAGFLLIVAISAVFDGGQFALAYLGGEPLTQEAAKSSDFQLAVRVVMALSIPLFLLFSHASGLVHWHGVSPMKSLFFSLVAIVRNLGAFTVYGLGWLFVFAMSGIAMTLVSGLLAAMGLGSALDVLFGTMVALAMMLTTMYITSIVLTFRDCFEPPEQA
ncbi:MAG: BPSS1780 family membrane protein, partial [Giesbergeria sp.]